MAMTNNWGVFAEVSGLVFPFNSDMNSTEALKVFTKWEELQDVPSRRIQTLFQRETGQLRENAYRKRWNVSMNVSLSHANLIMDGLYDVVRGCGDNFYWYDIMRNNFTWDSNGWEESYRYLVRFDGDISRELQIGGTRVILTFPVVEVDIVNHGG